VKRIVVTGGAGFIGARLCRELLRLGHEVIALDNFYSGKKSNVFHLLANHPGRFELVRHDVTQPFHVECDQIYNLACPASPVYYQRDPIKTLHTAVNGAYHALELARRCDARILQASTSEVYGDPEVHPQPETYRGNVDGLTNRACYDQGKRAAETLCHDYGDKHHVSIRIARIFNTYGPGMRIDDGRVIASFVRAALSGQPIQVFGDGTQTRSFCYLSDLVDGLIRLMEYDEYPVGGEAYTPFNLGNPGEVRMIDLAEKIIDFVWDKRSAAPRPQVEFVPLPQGDPRRRCPDITKAERFLGWSPKTDFDRGLAITVEALTDEWRGSPR
jgi:UDP-glucuronate decarboxylase